MPIYATSMMLCERGNSVIKSFGLGGTVSSFTYGVYGWRRPPVMAPAIGFNGQRIEPRTEWYSLGHGHRVYNPVLRRFHGPDRKSPFDKGGLNAYVYCLGDPVNHEDPTGQFGTEIVMGVVNRVRTVARRVSDYIHDYDRWVNSLSFDNLFSHVEDIDTRLTFTRNVMGAAAVLLPTPANLVPLFIGAYTVGASISSNLSLIVGMGTRAYRAHLPTIIEVTNIGRSRLSQGLNVLQQARGNYWGSPNATRSSSDLVRDNIRRYNQSV